MRGKRTVVTYNTFWEFACIVFTVAVAFAGPVGVPAAVLSWWEYIVEY